uniref:Kelch-like family member 21 n=1 Tax=Astatotilapia calliptera TaxID=8154 RepID=A0A3P8QDD2_ASTCA
MKTEFEIDYWKRETLKEEKWKKPHLLPGYVAGHSRESVMGPGCFTRGRITVTQDNVDLLLKTADLFQFPRSKRHVVLFWSSGGCFQRLEIQDFAEAYACKELAASARRFVLKNIMELAKGTDFERLPWKRLLEFVSDDELCVDKEETVYQIAVRWVKADLQRRLHYWPELLQQVRLPFVRRFFLLAHVESDPLVYLSPTCLRMVNEARSFQSCEYDRHDRPCHRMRPRPSTGLAEILVVVGGCDQDCDELVTVDCYNPHTGQWRYLAEFPDHLGGGYSIAALGNDMYVTGKLSEDIKSKAVMLIQSNPVLFSTFFKNNSV